MSFFKELKEFTGELIAEAIAGLIILIMTLGLFLFMLASILGWTEILKAIFRI